MATADRLREQIARYYELVDAEDFPAMLELFTEDCRYRRPGYEPLVGRDRLGEFYATERVIESGSHELEAIVVEGERAASAGVFRGHLRDGRDVEVGFAELFGFDGDRIAERTTYFHRPAV